MELFTLSVKFGQDQQIGIDNLLAEMKSDNHIHMIHKEPEGNLVRYIIGFRSIYAAYLFGHKQGSDLTKYIK